MPNKHLYKFKTKLLLFSVDKIWVPRFGYCLKMKQTLIFISFCVLSALAGPAPKGIKTRSESNSRIIGGVSANTGEFPFAASIYYSTSNGRYFCGGSLVHTLHVLTSATCTNDAISFQVYLGSIHLTDVHDPNRIIVATTSFSVHPDFQTDNILNDVGIIRFRIPIVYNDYVNPVELPTFLVQDYAVVTALGWGQTSDANPNFSDSLMQVPVTIIPFAECKAIYQNYIDDKKACIQGNYNEGTCYGDLGGPLIQLRSSRFPVQVGISSFLSEDGCESLYPSGFTLTYYYLDWISNQTEIIEGN